METGFTGGGREVEHFGGGRRARRARRGSLCGRRLPTASTGKMSPAVRSHYSAPFMTTRRLSISAPPALSSLYADSDGDQRGFPQHGHDRALGKSLKMDSVAAINEQVPTPVVGQGFLGDPGPCRFPPKPTLVRISFPAT